jgi:hypothetical protein
MATTYLCCAPKARALEAVREGRRRARSGREPRQAQEMPLPPQADERLTGLGWLPAILRLRVEKPCSIALKSGERQAAVAATAGAPAQQPIE